MAEPIKALLGLMKLAPAALLQRARKVYAGMKGNPAYPNPTISMEALAGQIETYSSCVVEASDGSRRAIARSYELRWAPRLADGKPGDWKILSFGKTKEYLSIKGLTPGTFYLFQVRALIDKVFTDWTDPVTKMCK